MSLSLEPILLDEVLRECQDMIEPQAQKRGISASFPQFEVPCYVNADRTRVKQVLINLLSNAIKYNKVGGSVVVDHVASTPGRIRICVRDSGEGLTADKMPQLFQPFNRLGQEASGEEGTGIGMVTTKRLIELMGGSIGAESTVGTGSVFWIELNLSTEPRLSHLTAKSFTSFQAPIQSEARIRTLLYDDRLTHAIALAKRHTWMLAVMFLDLDRFKDINDTHGHAVGDQVLKEVAKRLLQNARDEDTVCRNGGGEFLYLLMMNPQNTENIERFAATLLTAVGEPVDAGEPRSVISASIGIAVYPVNGASGEQLIRNADAAMHRAKKHSRGWVLFEEHDPEQVGTIA